MRLAFNSHRPVQAPTIIVRNLTRRRAGTPAAAMKGGKSPFLLNLHQVTLIFTQMASIASTFDRHILRNFTQPVQSQSTKRSDLAPAGKSGAFFLHIAEFQPGETVIVIRIDHVARSAFDLYSIEDRQISRP